MALHASGKYVYSVSEVDVFNGFNNSGGIAAYKIDIQTGNLTLVNKPVPSLGGSPAYIGLDLTNKWIGVANYGSGNYGIWRILEDYSIAEKPTSFFQDHGKGPMPQQDGPHAHELVFNPSNSFAVIPDLGTDSWMQYNFDPNSGELHPFSEPFVKSSAGSGPRHIAYHPKLPYAYGVSEIASTVTVFHIGQNTPLVPVQTISTLPSPVPSAAAELQFSPDGKVLYVSNRLIGLNGTIVIFNIDQSSGRLINIGYTDTNGIYPRFFTLSKDSTGKFFIVANQLSNNIRVFERNIVSGLIGRLVGFVDNIIQPSHILQV